MNDKTTSTSKSESAASSGRSKAKGAAKEAGAALSDGLDDLEGIGADATEQIGAQAKEAAQAMRDKAADVAEQGKSAGADRIEGFARAARGAADDLAEQSPQAAHYVREAAAGIERVSSSLRERSVGELAGMVEDFARRQPLAFFGTAVFAGFALTRFLKSSSETSSRMATDSFARDHETAAWNRSASRSGFAGSGSSVGTAPRSGSSLGTAQTTTSFDSGRPGESLP